jgi:hypothetical protein
LIPLYGGALLGVHYVQLSLKYPRERTLMPCTTDLHEMIVYDENSSELTMYGVLQQIFEKHIKNFSLKVTDN